MEVGCEKYDQHHLQGEISMGYLGLLQLGFSCVNRGVGRNTGEIQLSSKNYSDFVRMEKVRILGQFFKWALISVELHRW